MRNFEVDRPNTYCCGTVFAPKKDKTWSAKMILESSNKLRIDAKYGSFTGSRILDRILKILIKRGIKTLAASHLFTS